MNTVAPHKQVLLIIALISSVAISVPTKLPDATVAPTPSIEQTADVSLRIPKGFWAAFRHVARGVAQDVEKRRG